MEAPESGRRASTSSGVAREGSGVHMSRGPRYKESLPSRIIEFFAANPGEELTYEDICTKFDARPNSAMTAVSRLKADGILKSMHVIRPIIKRAP